MYVRHNALLWRWVLRLNKFSHFYNNRSFFIPWHTKIIYFYFNTNIIYANEQFVLYIQNRNYTECLCQRSNSFLQLVSYNCQHNPLHRPILTWSLASSISSMRGSPAVGSMSSSMLTVRTTHDRSSSMAVWNWPRLSSACCSLLYKTQLVLAVKLASHITFSLIYYWSYYQILENFHFHKEQ